MLGYSVAVSQRFATPPSVNISAGQSCDRSNNRCEDSFFRVDDSLTSEFAEKAIFRGQADARKVF